ncbi:hypothetical protein L3Q82_019071, partial [Scortum barcoo]
MQLLFVAPSLVSSISVSTPAELHASKGDTVTLSCSFTSTSRPTSKMTVDWSYRPQSGGPPQTFFHFSSRAFLPLDGQFAGRIRWQGSPARGEASLSLINATLNDNGTFTCSVRNPPDVHGSPTSHTVLTVTPKVPSIRFSDVAVLLAFVLLPSCIITLVLIGRMLCPKKQHSQSKSYRSPIEVTEGEEYGIYPGEAKEKRSSCCDLFLMDSKDRLESQSFTHIAATSVEKNEEADQKIEQDGTTNKPEDKAHKAATKIQASFRGHITRKKMKDGEEEKEGDSPAAAEEATEGGEEAKKAEGEEAPAKAEEAAGEEAKKEEETSQAKSPVADKPANSPAAAAASPAGAATSPVASPTAATAPSETQKEEPKAEEKAEEKPKEVEAPVAAAKSPTTATAEEKKEEEESEEKKEEARQADVPAAVSPTAEMEEPNQTKDKQ